MDVNLIHLGIAARRAGDRARALKIFDDLVTANPNDTWARYELVDETKIIQGLEAARKKAEEGLLIPSPSQHNYAQMIDLYYESDMQEECRTTIAAALKKFPQSATVWMKYLEIEENASALHSLIELYQQSLRACSSLDQREKILEHFAKFEVSRHIKEGKIENNLLHPIGIGDTLRDPVYNACIVSLIKDEGDIIFDNLSNHYRAGFRLFCIVNNGSVDETLSEISRFKALYADCIVVVIDDPVVEHFQDKKLTAAAKFMVEYSSGLGHHVEWIYPMDADEFIRFNDPNIGLADFCKLDAKIIVFPLMNAAPDDALDIYSPGDVHDKFIHIDRSFSRRVVKVAFRYSDQAQIHLGNHFVGSVATELEDIYAAPALGAFIKHLPYRSVRHTILKITNGYHSLVSKPAVPGGDHWRHHWENYKIHGEAWVKKYVTNYSNAVKNQSS